MSKRRRWWVEPLKTLAIVLLCLSACYLLLRTNLLGDELRGEGLLAAFSSLLPGGQAPDPGPAEHTGGLIHPVRLVVTNPQLSGRYGMQYDQETVDARFGGGLLNLFSDALTGAGQPKQVSDALWRKALDAEGQAGVYVDLLGSVPGDQLPVWLGGRAANGNLVGQVRRLLLTTDQSGGAVLYYSNERDGSYYACSTPSDLGRRLLAAAAEFEPNNARFAFEDPEQYAGLDPYTLILPGTPRPEVYAAHNPVPADSQEQGRLIRDLAFHPQSNMVNLDDVVVREGTDTLRISPTGVVSFYSASPDSPRYPVGDGEGDPTESQMVAAAWALLERCVAPRVGAARLVLSAVEQEGAGTVVYFCYQLDGAAVQVGGDGYAARVLIESGRIAAFTLQLRRYEGLGTTSIVLPEVLAAAAMEPLGTAEGALVLCYMDQRGDQVTAGWVTR